MSSDITPPSLRPSLKVDPTLLKPALQSVRDTLNDFDSHLSPGSSQAGSATTPRSYSHSRSQSLSEAREVRPEPSPPMAAPQNELVRRHHTLSSSRLVRIERSKARQALSIEDQEYYNVPPSPVGGPGGLADARAAWSDLGHSVPSGVGSRALGGGEWPVHSRATSHNSALAPTWGTSEGTTLPTNFFPVMDSPASVSSFEVSPPLSAAKRSSFVVLRGAKGDAALSERRPAHAPISPPRTVGRSGTPPRPPDLKHRNSLKPFLEAEDADALGQQEEWEKSLQDERDKEELELRREGSGRSSTYSTPPLPSSATSFPHRGTSPYGSITHNRANTLSHPQQYSIASVTSSEAWINGVASDDPALRRHQSLNFRQDEVEEAWPQAHDRGVSEDLFLGSSEGFSRSRSGNRPPSLSLSSQNAGNATPLTSLSHSNSLSSHGHGSSHSHQSHGGALSPVGVFPRSPWSPTLEETKQLGMGIAAVGSPPPTSTSFPARGLSRGGSSSSKGSTGGIRYGDEVGRLGEEMAALDVTTAEMTDITLPLPPPSKPPTPPGLDIAAALASKEESAPSNRAPMRSMTMNTGVSPNRRLPPLMTNPDVLASLTSGSAHAGMNAQSQSFISRQGPASAAAYVPPIGHSHVTPARAEYRSVANVEPAGRGGNSSAAPGGGGADWTLKKESLIGAATSSSSTAAFPTAVGVNPLGEAWPAGGGFGVGLAMQQQQQIQLLQSQMQQAMQVMDMMKAQGHTIPAGFPMNTAPPVQSRAGPNVTANGQLSNLHPSMTPPPPVFSNAPTPSSAPPDSPLDLPTLIANKGYNPAVFDLRPPQARFFVIKSYTEEDVHKSLKYEIWASTDLGNKRLDRAFRESADKGPIYLFFSVNGSGHFAGMAQMLTPVDYAMSSNVWASDKWKGVLKVRWIFIKDVPLASLRHIRLSNTPENKPVTSSRDTQEVPFAAGLEVLRIIHSFQSRTSLLQDFHWYEARTESGETGPLPAHYQHRTTGSPQLPVQPPQQQYQSQQYQPASNYPHQYPAVNVPQLSNMNNPNNGRQYFGDGAIF